MEVFNKIQTYLDSLDQKRFFQYLLGAAGILMLLVFLLIFNYFRTVGALKSEVQQINEYREEAQLLLSRAQRIKRDQKEIDAVLAQDKNFKIKGYFDDLINKQGLAQKVDKELEVSSAATQGKYQESILDAKFSGISMKNLTELLQEIEANKRIFIKELEISAAKDSSIDVTLIIATLEPKQEETSG